MKEDELKNIQQKQLLINRLYKSKNNPSANRGIVKPEDTKLLFYVNCYLFQQTRKKSFKEEEAPRSFLPKISVKKSVHEETYHNEGIASLRSTRGNSFSFKEKKNYDEGMISMTRRPSFKQPFSSYLIEQKVPLSPIKQNSKNNDIPIYNTEVATFFKMVRQKKLTSEEFIYMIRKDPNDHYNMDVVPYSEIVKKNIVDYYTFSCKGVSKFVNSKPAEFISVEEWFDEVKAFNEICKYNFFIMFRKWKSLKKWMKVVISEKMKSISKILEEKMFLTNAFYQKIILNHQTLSNEVRNLSFSNFLSRDPISKYDLLIKKSEKTKYFSMSLNAFSKKMHENSTKGINVILATLKYKIKKEDSKKEDALGFPENMNYGDRAMMRHELIRIVRLSYLLEFMVIESLGRCYMQNIDDVLNMIEIEDYNEEYFKIMKPLKYVEASKSGKEKVNEKKPYNQPSTVAVPASSSASPYQKNVLQPIFQVTFDFDPNKSIPYVFISMDEEYKKTLLDFDLNYWDSNKYRNFTGCEYMVKIIPQYSDLTYILVSFFKESTIERGIKNWRNDVDIYVDSLYEWDDVIGGRTRNRYNTSYYADPSFWLKEFPIMSELVPRIQKAMKISYENVYEFRNEYRDYINLYQRLKTTNFEDLETNKYESKNEMLEKLVNLNDWLLTQMRENLEETNEVSIYEINSKYLNKNLVAEQYNNQQRLIKFIEKHMEKICTEAEDYFERSIEKLSGPLIGIEDYSKQKDNINEINNSLSNITEKVELMNMLPILLPDFKNGSLKKRIDKAIVLSAQCSNLLSQVYSNCTNSIDKFKKEYKEKYKKLNRQFYEFLTYVQDKKWLTPQGQGILLLKPKIDRLEEKVQKMLEFYEVLEINGDGNYESLYTLKSYFDLRYSLWKGIYDFEMLKYEWEKQTMKYIQVKPLIQRVDQYFRIVNQCERNLGDNPIVPKLKKMVLMFKYSLPAVNALKSQHLEYEHVLEISTVLKTQFNPQDEAITLKDLLNLNIETVANDLIYIATKAYQERQLKYALTQVESVLYNTDMCIKSYKDGSSYILGQVDELTVILDESLASVNNTLANRYVKAIRPRAYKLSAEIQMTMEIVYKWVYAQRKWMYLYNIFVAPDIKQQMPLYSKSFEICDKFIKDHVKRINTKPKINRLVKIPNLLKNFVENVKSLEYIEKKLYQYLYGKRQIFPRFYFLSNDELLEILSKSGNLEMVYQNLGKCFEALVKFYMVGGKPTSETNAIEGMISPYKERVSFKNIVTAKNNVEIWLGQLQKYMYETVRKIISVGYHEWMDGKFKTKTDWIMAQSSQVVAVASQIIWTLQTYYSILENEKTGYEIEKNLQMIIRQLRYLTLIVRGEIPSILRKVIVALITIYVHNRDIVDTLNKQQCESLNDFLWLQQLRYYLQEDKTIHKQVTSTLEYGYEYLGATSRLVITPLTDRCWITITSALANKLGASPAGPAGTGKTESTKDLAKALGRLCIVFNCSDQITAKMMNKLFKGLAQQGAWACLDEFNRIDIEVLSVIAQQLLVIRMALLRDRPFEPFEFDGQTIPILPNYGVFITMNPGYAGRTYLPDNLKSLFRPVSMMIPDYAMIAEIMLFAYGFENASLLSKKMVQLYKLSSEQLSSQDHYDFGMRAVKSLLVMAGSLKRAEPNLEEDSILIKAMKFSNIPKFVKDDIPLFTALIYDLFPTTEIPPPAVSQLQYILPAYLAKNNLQSYGPFEEKIIQLYDTFNVRFGVMLVGQAGSGKSTCFKMLAHCASVMKEKYVKGFENTHYRILNPKSISMGYMYGYVDPFTQEWVDGLASSIIRYVNTPRIDDADWNPNEKYWVVFDGPVDALWIENMNTVLDDNMTLCLANAERIKLRPYLRMLFYVQDLSVASPATVSRCGMVYLSFDNLDWSLYVKSWLSKMDFQESHKYFIFNLFHKTLYKAFFKKKKLYEPFPTTLIQIATNICSIFQSIKPSMKLYYEEIVPKVLTVHYIYCMIWGLGGGISFTHNQYIQSIIEDSFPDFTFPRTYCVFDHMINPYTQQSFISWATKVPQFYFDKDAQFFYLLVPTIDTIKYSHVIELMIDIEKPIILTGESGVGKSVLVGKLLSDLKERKGVSTIFLNFSAQTKAKYVQLAIESKLIKKGKTLFGARPTEKICVFIDDVNMPALEFYGAQPCIELLRQMVDLGGLYDRHKLFFKQVEDTTLIPVCAPPGGGRNQLSFRFLRRLLPLMFPTPSSGTAFKIFNGLLAPKCSFSEPIVLTTLAVFYKISKYLLPTPSKFQYIYNMRDIGKVIQNIGKGKYEFIVKLFIHELRRVFADRMVGEDYQWFKEVVQYGYKRYFSNLNLLTDDTFNVLFTDILKLDGGVSIYEEVTDPKKLYKILENKQYDYNFSNNDKLYLVFFEEAVQQILRICRIIRQPRGNAMLIGVGGSGKQSLSKLASFIMKCDKYQIYLVKNYNSYAFREDLRKIAKIAGGERKPLSFIFTDVQIAYYSFLYDINNILNTGEVPNLFIKKEDFEYIYNMMRPYAAKKKVQDSPEYLWNLFINCIRENLHIILCMSPVGYTLRVRCRKFPSLINCTSLDWFPNWPKEALIEVANKFIADIEFPDYKVRNGIIEMCMNVSIDVTSLCDKYVRELRRKVYTTPKSYLDHIKLYKSLLAEKRNYVYSIRRKLTFGLYKLYTTNETVAKLQGEMTILKPKLAQQSIKTEEFLKQLAIDTKAASQVESVVQDQAEIVNGEQLEIKMIADYAQTYLNKALPALKDAAYALKSIKKDEINEVKSYLKPHPAIQMVLEAVCILLYYKADWDGAKKVMNDIGFFDRLKEFDKDSLANKDMLLRKLRVLTRKPEFDIDYIGKKSSACRSLAMWAKAMDVYAKVSKYVEPKKKKVAELSSRLEVKNKELKVKQDYLNVIKSKVAKLQKECDYTLALKQKLEEDMIRTNNRLISAYKLTVLLEEEGIRWKEQIYTIGEELLRLIGDVFLSAATISYLGPFTGAYREPVITVWKYKFTELEIPFSYNYSLADTLQKPLTIREWVMYGLSNDILSIDNGVIATKCERWPLFIDPQGYAHKWIKKHEEKNSLKITSFSDKNFLGTIQTAIESGYSVLLYNVYEKLYPSLDSVLQKQTFEYDNRIMIRVGERKLAYHKNFKLFLTTKISNPNYLPYIFIKVTVINFSITFEGLKDQLLGDVVKFERPEIYKQKDYVVVSISYGKKLLKYAQDNILTLLSESKGNILDNIELIQTLEESKKSSAIIKKKLEYTTVIEEQVNISRSSYIPIAIRGTVLYFVITDLALIDPMYQFSLKYFKKLFGVATYKSAPSNVLVQRINSIMDSITKLMFTDICRGLFESHKKIYSFLICTSIRRYSKLINFSDWNYLFRGTVKEAKSPNPDPSFISQPSWDFLSGAEENCTELKGIVYSIKTDIKEWKPFAKEQNLILAKVPERFAYISPFSRLILTKGLAPYKIMREFSNYVQKEMGSYFDEIKSTTIEEIYNTADYKTPIIFILSTGADPTSGLIKFAQEKGKQLSVISLGQGQGEKAEKLIEKSKPYGSWVLLTNCHLAKSWMPSLEKIVLDLQEHFKGNENFRLILTSMPADYFPVPILQNGSKLTLEPPRGIRANLKKSFTELNDKFFKDCDAKNRDWHKLVFTLSFFHAIIQYRRKFGPLGFNIRYEFNDSDLSIAFSTLKMFLDTPEDNVPWYAMLYMTGHINYGGRVTDDWDRVCLLSILKKYYNQEVLNTYKFELSASKLYFVPEYGNLKSYLSYISNLPSFEDPEVFGMHENANITYQNQESNKIMETILSIQPRISAGGSGGKSPDEIVMQMADYFEVQLPYLLSKATGNQDHFVTNEEGNMHSLSIVLLQEMEKFNNLLSTLKKTLTELKRAIKGFAVMSQELDEMYLAFQNNSLPGLWRKVSFASLKPLASWFKDMVNRVYFLRNWLNAKAPFSYWMSGFYFPQGFLTGVLQAHSRLYKIPIDTLSFKFKVLAIDNKYKLTAAPYNGVYVDGLFLDGARWDVKDDSLADQVVGKLYFPMPIIHFLPTEDYTLKHGTYRCPCYKTSNRAGVLSTTGQSTNFILPVDLPTKHFPSEFWTLRGTALLSQLDD